VNAPVGPKSTKFDPSTPSEGDPLRGLGAPSQGAGEHTLRVVETHVSGLVARARARLEALVERLRSPTLRRLAGHLPGVAAPLGPSEAAAFEEATREAFRAATLKSAMPLGRIPTAGPLPAAPAAALPAAPVSPRTVPTSKPEAVTLAAPPEAESPAHTSWAPRPAAPVSARSSPAPKPVVSPRPKPRAVRPAESRPAPTTRSPAAVATPPRRRTATATEAEPDEILALSAAPGGQPARRSRRHAGGTPLDHLLAAPTGVDSAADGFFDALARRVEGDR
jgi:hypothetical protein